MTLTKFASEIRAIKSDGININAAAAKPSDAKTRLAALHASATDPVKKAAFARARSGAARLGFSLDELAQSGATRHIDAAMKAANWSIDQRFAFKTALAACGVLD